MKCIELKAGERGREVEEGNRGSHQQKLSEEQGEQRCGLSSLYTPTPAPPHILMRLSMLLSA